MAHLNPRTLTPTLRTPGPSTRDSDDVLVALETARSLEARGDMAEAARWLRRAADEAEKQGNDMRVLVFAHAAADLSASRPSSGTRASASKATPRMVAQRPPQDSEPTLHWRAAKPPPLPVRSASTPAASQPISILRERAIAAEEPVAERPLRMGAIRVAVKTPTPNSTSFEVERLDANQPLPPGTVEALLVLATDVDAPREIETDPLVQRAVRRT